MHEKLALYWVCKILNDIIFLYFCKGSQNSSNSAAKKRARPEVSPDKSLDLIATRK